MRINKFVAQASGVSRREADDLVADGRIKVNGSVAELGQQVETDDDISLDNKKLVLKDFEYLLINKPIGYVCSQKAQGGYPTIYELIPEKYRHLQVAGRLDQDSSGLVILTNDGQYAYQLTHPKFEVTKTYKIKLNKELETEDKERIIEGVQLEDGTSKLNLQGQNKQWIVSMHEGRNRQIRRTFDQLSYSITELHRTKHGKYQLDDLATGEYKLVNKQN